MSLLEYYPQWLAYRRWLERVPGVQVAVRRHGELGLSAATGWADLDDDVRLTPDHLFRIASHSKSFTAVLVLQLVETGRLQLDDTIGAHVPELTSTPVADRTIRELLAHGGGVIRDGEDGDFWQSKQPFPDRDELLALTAVPSAATLPRNEHFKYSNIAFGLLGMLLETVTGSTFADLVRSRIAEPLALSDTGGEYDPGRADDYAAGYSSQAVARSRASIAHLDTRALAAATGCYATARDLTAFFSALLPGQNELLSDDLQRIQRRPQWDVKDDESRYGLGVFLSRIAEIDLFGHTGGYPGHITASYADPKDGWVISVLTNSMDGPATTLASGFWHLLHLGREGSHATCTVEDADRFTGRFAVTWGVIDVAHLDGRLYELHPTDADPEDDPIPLEIVDRTTLRICGGRGGNSIGELMRFDFADDGSVRSVRGDSGMTMTPFSVPDEA